MGRPRRQGRRIDGWIALDKPAGLTSAEAVARVRQALGAQKAGHGGTLDPMATGLLPIAFGEATKTVAYTIEARKTYCFTVRWGQATDTDDRNGDVVEECAGHPERAAIEAMLPRFVGAIDQVPPAYSAVKVDGRRAYDLARRGEAVELEARPVVIHRLRLVAMEDSEHASFEAVCGKGCYMRALARDLGRALETCAHLTALRRVAVGAFHEEQMISLETLEALGHSAAALEHLLPVEAALDDIPALVLTDIEANRLRRGQKVSLLRRAHLERIRELSDGAMVCAKAGGKAVALARFEAGDIRPVRVLNL